MKILFIASSGPFILINGSRISLKKGHDILWYSMTDGKTWPTNFAGKFCQSRAEQASSTLCFVISAPTQNLAKNYKPDIIHAHSAGHYGLLASLLPHRQLVITVWGSDIVINTKKFFHRQLLRRFLPRQNSSRANSPHVRNNQAQYQNQKWTVGQFWS